MDYDFDELQLPGFGSGLLLSGKARFKDNGDGDFFVASITLEGGKRLTRPATHDTSIEAHLYRAIEPILYSDKTTHGQHAALEWSDFLADRNQPDPDDRGDYLRDLQRDREEA